MPAWAERISTSEPVGALARATDRRARCSGSLVVILANLQRADLRFQGGRRQAEPCRRSVPPGHLPSGLRERRLDHLSLAPDERVPERQDRWLPRAGLLGQ